MAAPNFHKINASRYFCMGRAYYTTQEDIDELELPQELLGTFDQGATENNYQWAKENLLEQLKQAGYTEPSIYDRLHNEANYGSYLLAVKEHYLQFAGAEWTITMRVMENSGYYSGSCLDYEATLTCINREGYDCDMDCDLTPGEAISTREIADADPCSNYGLSKLQAPNIAKRIRQELQQLTSDLELILSRCCQDELYQEYCFSYCGFAGEAGYNAYPKRLYQEREAA